MAQSGAAKPPTPWLVGVVFVTWFLTNVVINLYNKWLLGKTDFRFPFLLTTSNKFIGLCGSILTLCLSKCIWPDEGHGLPNIETLLHNFKRPIVHLHGATTALNIALNNWSLVFISMTLNQLVKAVVPLPTVLLSVGIERKSYSWQVYASMLVVILGTLLASWNSTEANWQGMLLATGSVLAAAVWTVISAVLMQSGEKPLDAVSLIFVSSPTSIVVTMCFFVFLEEANFSAWISAPGSNREPFTLVFIALGGLLGFWYDIIHNQFLKLTSSVTMAIMGNTKLVVLIVFSMIFFEATPRLNSILGVALGLAGIFWYSWFKQCEAEERRRAAAAESSSGPPKVDEATTLLEGGSACEPAAAKPS